MKDLGKEMEAKFGPDSEFQRKVKQQAEKLGAETSGEIMKVPFRSKKWRGYATETVSPGPHRGQRRPAKAGESRAAGTRSDNSLRS